MDEQHDMERNDFNVRFDEGSDEAIGMTTSPRDLLLGEKVKKSLALRQR